MASVISGEGLGLFNSSLNLLGTAGTVGSGQTGDKAYINSTTGNLILQHQDEFLASTGLDIALARTYNSQGQFDGDNNDNWRLNVYQQLHSLTGTVNTAGSTITKVMSDGHETIYSYDVASGNYLSNEGSGAQNSLTYSTSTSQWIWIDGNSGISETYDNNGQLLSKQDIDGNTHSYIYTGSLITEIQSSNGQSVFLDYVGNNLSQIRTVSAGITQTRTHYTYDAQNRLEKVIVDLTPEDNAIADANTYTTTYTYDGTSNNIASITSGDGTHIAFTYDAQGRVETYTDGTGQITSFTYTEDTIGVTTDVTDALGHVTSYITDSNGYLVETLSPTVNGTRLSTQYSYNASGDVSSVIDGNGQVINYQYDINGNLTQQQNSEGNTVRYTYNTTNQLLTQTVYLNADPDGLDPLDEGILGSPTAPLTTRNIYDAEDHLRFSVSGEGRVTEYNYNAAGERISTVTYNENAYGLTGLLETDSLSETQLQTWTSTQDLSQTQRIDYTYDFRGNLDTTTTYASINATGVGVVDGTEHVSQFVYDQANQLLQTIDARGTATTVIPDDYITYYTYDGLGRLLSSTDALGNNTITSYDDANNRAITTLANGLATTSVYDSRGLLLSQTQTAPDATPLGTTTYTYDVEGQLRYTQDPLAQRDYILYDEAGRIIATVDTSGALTENIYDNNGNVLQQIAYANRLSTTTLATLSAVDVNGDLLPVEITVLRLEASDPTQDRSAYTLYDKAGRPVISLTPTDDDATQAYVTRSFYDGAGRITDVIQYATAIDLTLLPANLIPDEVVVTPDLNHDRHSRIFYNADGQVVASLDAEGYLTENHYNNAGQLIETIGYATQLTDQGLRSAGVLNAITTSIGVSAADRHAYSLYNTRGEVIASIDGDHYLTEYGYDLAGNQTDVVRYDTTVNYTGTETLAALRPAASNTDHASVSVYDALNRISTVTNAVDNTTTEFEYDNVGNVVSTTLAVNTSDVRTLRTQYDAAGRVTAELSGEGSVALDTLLQGTPTQTEIDALWDTYSVQYTYDAKGRRLTTTDQNGNTTWYYYDENDRLTVAIQSADGGKDVNGNTLVNQGEVTQTSYNAFGQVIDTTQFANRIGTTGLIGGDVTDIDAVLSLLGDTINDSRSEINYTLRGAIKTALDSENYTTTNTYNAFGETTSTTQQLDKLATPTTVATQFNYDKRGLLTNTFEDVTGLNRHNQTQYDAFGRVISLVDGNNTITGIDYSADSLGRKVVTITDSLTHTTVTTYDAFDRVLTQTDKNNNSVVYSYDDATRSVTITTAEGIQTTTTKNRLGETITLTDANNITTQYEYDKNGNLKTVTDAVGTADEIITTSINYDEANRVIETVDANNVLTQTTYDAANRVISRTFDPIDVTSNPNGLNITTTYAYDAKGQVASQTDANGTVTQTEYDKRGQVSAVVVDAYDTTTNPDGLNIRTEYSYDGRGKTLTVTEGAGTIDARTTQYKYDKLGRRTQTIIDPIGLALTTQYEYDNNDNIIATTDANNNVTRFIYDVNDLMTYRVNASGGVTFNEYNGNGQITKDIAYTTAIDVNALPLAITLNDLVIVEDLTDQITEYVYDKDGRLTTIIKAVGLPEQVTQSYDYDATGQVVREGYGNNITTHYTYHAYDDLGQLSRSINAEGYVTDYSYDVLGNIEYKTVYMNSVALPVTNDVNWASNAPNPIANNDAISGDRVTYYQYDAAGRLEMLTNVDNVITRYTYDSLGQLTLLVEAEGLSETRTTRNVYDQAGNLIEQITALGTTDETTTRYTYDHVGNQVSVIDPRGVELAEDDTVWAQAERQRLGYSATSSLLTLIEQEELKTLYTIHQEFDAANRKTASVDALGGRMQTDYDTFGNIIKTIDPNNNIAYFYYDNLNRMSMQVDPAGYMTYLEYDVFGNVVDTYKYANSVTGSYAETSTIEILADAPTVNPPQAYLILDAAKDQLTHAEYDALNRTTSITDAENYTEDFSYDAMGNVLTHIDKNRNLFVYEYDGLGNKISEYLPVDGYGNNWDAATSIYESTGGVSEIKIETDNSNNAIAVWVENDGVSTNIYAKRYDSEEGWGAPTLLETNSGNATAPQIKFDYQGNALAIWTQFDGVNTNVYSAKYDVNTGWQTTTLIELSAGNATTTKIAFDGFGNAIAVWTQFDGVNTNILSARYDVNNGWESELLVETNIGDAKNPEIAFDGEGNAKIVWLQLDGTSNQILTKNYNALTGWEATSVLVDVVEGINIKPQLVVDSKGNALVAWDHLDVSETLYVPGPLYSKYFDINSGWGARETIASNGLNFQLSMDNKDRPVVVWETGNFRLVAFTSYDITRTVNFSRFELGAWDVTPVGSEPSFYTILFQTQTNERLNPRIVSDAKGNIQVTWSRHVTTTTSIAGMESTSVDARISTRRLDAEDGWLETKVLYTGIGEPELAIDNSGNVISVWAQQTTSGSRILSERFENYDYRQVVNRFYYDALGNKVKTIEAEGLLEERITQYVYDKQSRLVETVKPQINLSTEINGASGELAVVNNELQFKALLAESTTLRLSYWPSTDINNISEIDSVSTVSGEITIVLPNPIDGEYAFEAKVFDVNGNELHYFTGSFNDLGASSIQAESVIAGQFQTPHIYKNYDANGNLITETDAKGFITYHYYDNLNRRIATVNAEGYLHTREYDAVGNVTNERLYAERVPATDSLGTEIDLSILPDPNVIDTMSATDYRETIYLYDANNQLIETQTQSVLIYDTLNGLQTQSLVKSTSYDANGQVVSETDANGNTTFFYYDSVGNLTVTVDALGYVKYRLYDGNGNVYIETQYASALSASTLNLINVNSLPQSLIDEVQAGSESINDRTILYSYDNMNRPISETMVDIDYSTVNALTGVLTDVSANVTTQAVYDGLGNRITEINAGNAQTDYTYDALSRLVKKEGASFTDSQGVVVRTTTKIIYDGVGNIRESNNIGVTLDDKQFNYYEYDQSGNLIKETDALGNSSNYFYDLNGNLTVKNTQHSNPDGTAPTIDTVYAYDKLNRQISTEDAANFTNYAEYSAYGEITVKGLNGLAQEYYEYDLAGRVMKTNKGDGVDKAYLYDANGNVTGEMISAGTSDLQSMLYTDIVNSAFEVTTTPSVVITRSEYDALNRMTNTYQTPMEIIPDIVETQDAWNNVLGNEFKGGTLSPIIGGVLNYTFENFYEDPAIVVGVIIDVPMHLHVDIPSSGYGDGNVRVEWSTGGGVYNGYAAADATSVIVSSDKFGKTGLTSYTINIFKQTNLGEILITSTTANYNWTLVSTSPRYTYTDSGTDKVPNTIQVTGLSSDSETLDFWFWPEGEVKNATPTGILSKVTTIDGTEIAGMYSFDWSGYSTGKYKYEYISRDLDGKEIEHIKGVIYLGDSPSVISQLKKEVEVVSVGSDASIANEIINSVSYNAFGEVIQEINGSNQITNFNYNQRGQLIGKIDPETDVTLENGEIIRQRPITKYYYDINGRTIGTEDANTNRTTQRFDDADHLVAEYHADGGIKEYGYDVFGNKKYIENEFDIRTLYTYDDNNQVVRIDRPTDDTFGNVSRFDGYRYDEAGRRIAHRNANGNWEYTWYDDIGRVSKTVGYAGVTTTYRYIYDAVTGGTKTITMMADGRTLEDGKDYFGRLEYHKDLGNRSFRYFYNESGWLTKQIGNTDPESKELASAVDLSEVIYDTVTSSNYASLGIEQYIEFDHYLNGYVSDVNDYGINSHTRYEYDANGNRTFEGIARTDPQLGTAYYQWSHVTYDELNRVKTITDPKYDLSYEYDANGNRRHVYARYHDGLGNDVQFQDYWYKYDEMNRFVVTKGSFSGLLIDGSGNPVLDANGDYQWNRSIGETIGAGDAGYSITYDRLSQRRTANNETYDYNIDGLLTTTHIDGVLRANRANYNAVGNVKSYFEYDSTGTVITRNVQNTYYANNKVNTATTDDNTVTYYYDEIGNLLSTYNPLDGANITTTYTYDYWDSAKQKEIKINGVTTGYVSEWKPGFSNFIYDVNGHLTKVSDEDANRHLSYKLNHNGQILQRNELLGTAASRTQYYYYINNTGVGDAGSFGTSQKDYAATLANRKPVEPENTDSFKAAIAKSTYEAKLAKWKDNNKVRPVSSADFDYNYQPINDSYPATTPGTYTVRNGDNLQSISLAVWGDSSLWYLIADANGIDGSTALIEGQNLVIPNVVTNIHNNASTFAVYNPGELLGDVSPTLPIAPPPPEPECNVLASIVVIVVVAIVTYYAGKTAGQYVGKAFAAAIGAAVGNAAGQVVAVELGIREEFSWDDVGIAAFTAGLTETFGFDSETFSGAAANNIVGQGVRSAFYDDYEFDWNSVAISAIAAPITARISSLDKDISNTGMNGSSLPGFARDLGVNFVNETIKESLTTLAYKNHKFDWNNVAAQSIGNTISSSIIADMKYNDYMREQRENDLAFAASDAIQSKATANGNYSLGIKSKEEQRLDDLAFANSDAIQSNSNWGGNYSVGITGKEAPLSLNLSDSDLEAVREEFLRNSENLKRNAKDRNELFEILYGPKANDAAKAGFDRGLERFSEGMTRFGMLNSRLANSIFGSDIGGYGNYAEQNNNRDAFISGVTSRDADFAKLWHDESLGSIGSDNPLQNQRAINSLFAYGGEFAGQELPFAILGPVAEVGFAKSISGLSRLGRGVPDKTAFGARGTYSGRDFDPDLAGGSLRELSNDKIKFTDRGIDVVEKHTARFGPDEANQYMTDRLRQIARGEVEATQVDRNFYSHELREYVRYRRQGWETGTPSNVDAGHDLWNNTHTATLEEYRIQGNPNPQLYHPEAMKLWGEF